MRFHVPAAVLNNWDGGRLSCHNWTPLDMVSTWPKEEGDSAGHTAACHLLKQHSWLDTSAVGHLGWCLEQ